MSDATHLTRLQASLAAGRMRCQALLEAQRWTEVADLARELARIERELALQGSADARRRFVHG